MAFVIYPDADTAALLGKPAFAPVSLAAGEAMVVFAPLATLVGSELATYIRIALSGGPVPAGAQPIIELLAQEPGAFGGDPRKVDPNIATSPGTAVALSGGLSPVAARAFFTPPYVDNVYLLTVVSDVLGSTFGIRITNTTGVARDVVWVAADGEEETRQPWIHATPAEIAFDGMTGTTTRRELRIANRGTGDLVVEGLEPGFPDGPYETAIGPTPLTIGPNASTLLRLELTAGDQAVAPQTIPQRLACNDPGSSFGAAGHNRDVSLVLSVGVGAPRFLPPPNEFKPKRGTHRDFDSDEIPGTEVTLFGANFQGPDLSVSFGEVDATDEIASRSPSEIRVRIPRMDAPRTVPIMVRVRGATAVSQEEFSVARRPFIEEIDGMRFAAALDPSHTQFTIIGGNFITDLDDRLSASMSFSELRDGFIRFDIVSFTDNQVRVRFPAVPDFFRFIGKTGIIAVTRSDDGRAEYEFFLEGL